MMKDCNKCGRSFDAVKPGCNYCDSCFEEYKYTMPACIRNQAPDCKAKAVIPSVTTQTVDGLTNLANCFVHVTDINTTFYVDDKHRPMIIWAGDVEIEAPAEVSSDEGAIDIAKGYNLRSQFLYIKRNQAGEEQKAVSAFYFDKTGKLFHAGTFVEIVEE